MIDHCYLLPSDLFQQLTIWLGTSMQSPRQGRRFLETHLALLNTETDRELVRLIAAYAEERPDMKQQMVSHLALLHDARKRGSSIRAIREAYINIYNGSSLDLPTQLLSFEKHQQSLLHLARPERTSRTRIALLRAALDECEYKVAPELTATLRNDLGQTLVQDLHPLTQADCLASLTEAISCHESALLTYSFDRYPLQYANTCIYLGNAWLRYGMMGLEQGLFRNKRHSLVKMQARQDSAIESAIACFAAALHVYQRDTFPEQWARLQSLLGRAYTVRRTGEPAENLERAIAYHEVALQVATPEALPTLWATIQTLLGDAYRLRRHGERASNHASATTCYKIAQQVFSQRLYPAEWAAVHIGLACLYQHDTGHNADETHTREGCALVCYEGALKVYTIDTFPIEHAATQVQLGDLHRVRTGGDPSINLEQAIRCYQAALRIYTYDAFPLEHEQSQLKLITAQAQRLTLSTPCR